MFQRSIQGLPVFSNCKFAICILQFAFCNSLIVVSPFASSARAQSPELPSPTVGMPVDIEQLVLPGPELEPLPVTDKTPVVIRIDAVYPHGTDFRYDLVCYGLEPGTYDLRDYLRRKDGSSAADLPPLQFVVNSQLPPGQIEPNRLAFGSLPWLGGYRLLLIAAGIIWVAGLVWLVYPRRKPAAAVEAGPVATPVTLADRLRPLVTDAIAGRLSTSRLAELERALVSYWRRRLGLGEVSPGEALARLRHHPEAGPLISQLEAWLHRPAGSQPVDVNALLEPYRNVAPDELDPAPAATLAGGAA
jgi:hypothetical protein